MVLVTDGVIENILPAPFALPKADELIDLKGSYLAAGFIDTHIHGSSGHGTDNKNPQDLLDMSDILLTQGVIGFTPTIYPGSPEHMSETLRILSPSIGKENGARIVGFHIEGPFISPKRPGVMKPEDIRPVSIEILDMLYKSSNGTIVSMTVAPELENIDLLVSYAKEHNILLQAGHTDATYNEMLQGVSLGITHVTHLFNAMRGIGHREPGAAGAVLTSDKISTEVIADGLHISPVIVGGMVLKLKKPGQIVLVTDSLNPTGKKEGLANGEPVYLDKGIFKRKTDNVIAGSSLTMLGGVRNLVSWGYSLGNACLAASDNPAKLHKLNFGSMEKGKKAAFVILDENLNLKGTII